MSGVPLWVGLCSIIGQFEKISTKRVSLVFLFLSQEDSELTQVSDSKLLAHHS